MKNPFLRTYKTAALAAATVILSLAAIVPASAQTSLSVDEVPAIVLSPVAAVDAGAASDGGQRTTFARPSVFDRAQRPSLLTALYVSQGVAQALDVHSTFAAIDRGAVEANPLMKGFVKNRSAMVALKSGVAVGTILIAERMWKKGNRKGAIATMVIANAVTFAVAANNYKVASSLR